MGFIQNNDEENGGGAAGGIIGTVLFIGAIIVFDVLSITFGWGWIIY